MFNITLPLFTHCGICLDIIRHTKTLFNVLHDSYMRESRSGSRAQVAAMLSVCTMYDHTGRYNA